MQHKVDFGKPSLTNLRYILLTRNALQIKALSLKYHREQQRHLVQAMYTTTATSHRSNLNWVLLL